MKQTFLLLLTLCSPFVFANDSILVQSTTSTANSGLYDYLLPVFEQQYNTRVNVVAVGTGQAIRNAGNCDADVLLVHAKDAEQEFVARGFGVTRQDLMYNDFVIIGPHDDPAGVAETANAAQALKRIANSQSVFASRGDNSGTHKKEQKLWLSALIDTKPHSGSWYRETGSGMGATLNTAIGMRAYTLTDRATWISFKNKQKHRILLEGDSELFNQYGVILVNNKHCQNVNAVAGQQFIDWITGDAGQALIAGYKLDGEQLFYPNAGTQ